MEQHDTSYDGSAFSKIYNQGLREGIMEAQENLTKVGYWEGLKRVGVVTNLLNKYISALLVLDSLIQRGLIIKKEESCLLDTKIVDTRKQLEGLLQKYESSLLKLGSNYVEYTQEMGYFMTQNPQLNESDTLEKLQRDWFSQLEYLESSTLEEAKERIQELVESMEEPIQHHFKEFLRHDNLLRE